MSEQNFQPGDLVALVHRGRWDGRISLQKGEVERVTATQVIALQGRRFKMKNGEEIGVTGSRLSFSPRLQRLTPELLAEEAQAEKECAAEIKCHLWAQRLERARGASAVELAALLPDLEA